MIIIIVIIIKQIHTFKKNGASLKKEVIVKRFTGFVVVVEGAFGPRN